MKNRPSESNYFHNWSQHILAFLVRIQMTGHYFLKVRRDYVVSLIRKYAQCRMYLRLLMHVQWVSELGKIDVSKIRCRVEISMHQGSISLLEALGSCVSLTFNSEVHHLTSEELQIISWMRAIGLWGDTKNNFFKYKLIVFLHIMSDKQDRYLLQEKIESDMFLMCF